MRLAQAWTIATHDMRLLRRRRSITLGLVAFPIAVALGFPLLVEYLLHRAGDAIPVPVLGALVDSFSFFFVIGAATIPVGIASYSIVGEKIEKSLEPLLSTPTTDGEILLGKTLAALIPTMLAVWFGSVVYMAVMDRVTTPTFGYRYFPNVEMAEILLLLAPLVCLFAVEASILISSRVTDVRSAQQLAALIFLPFVLLYVLGEIGVILMDATHLLYISGALALVVLGLFTVSRGTFSRDQILTQWR